MLRLRPHSATGSVTEFLPATLEIQESPPSPVGRAVTWTIMAVFAMAVLWASLSSIDIVAVAQGKIIPSEYSKDIIGFNQSRAGSVHRMRGTGDDNSRGDCASRTQSPSRDQRCPRWSDVSNCKFDLQWVDGCQAAPTRLRWLSLSNRGDRHGNPLRLR